MKKLARDLLVAMGVVVLLWSLPADATIAVLDPAGTGTLLLYDDSGGPLNIFNGSNSLDLGYSGSGSGYRDVAVLSNGDVVVIGPVGATGSGAQLTHIDVVGGTGTATSTFLSSGRIVARGAGLPGGGLAVYKGFPGAYQLHFFDAPVGGVFGTPISISLDASLFKSSGWGDNLYDDISLAAGQGSNTTDPDVAMVIFAPEPGTGASQGIYYFDKTGAGDLDNILVTFNSDTYRVGAGVTANPLDSTNEALVMRMWGDADDILRFSDGTPDTVTEIQINSVREAWSDLAYRADGTILALNAYGGQGTAEGIWEVNPDGTLIGSAPLIPLTLSYSARVDTYVPEPATLGLLGLGMLGVLLRRRR